MLSTIINQDNKLLEKMCYFSTLINIFLIIWKVGFELKNCRSGPSERGGTESRAGTLPGGPPPALPGATRGLAARVCVPTSPTCPSPVHDPSSAGLIQPRCRPQGKGRRRRGRQHTDPEPVQGSADSR